MTMGLFDLPNFFMGRNPQRQQSNQVQQRAIARQQNVKSNIRNNLRSGAGKPTQGAEAPQGERRLGGAPVDGGSLK